MHISQLQRQKVSNQKNNKANPQEDLRQISLLQQQQHLSVKKNTKSIQLTDWLEGWSKMQNQVQRFRPYSSKTFTLRERQIQIKSQIKIISRRPFVMTSNSSVFSQRNYAHSEDLNQLRNSKIAHQFLKKGSRQISRKSISKKSTIESVNYPLFQLKPMKSNEQQQSKVGKIRQMIQNRCGRLKHC